MCALLRILRFHRFFSVSLSLYRPSFFFSSHKLRVQTNKIKCRALHSYAHQLSSASHYYMRLSVHNSSASSTQKRADMLFFSFLYLGTVHRNGALTIFGEPKKFVFHLYTTRSFFFFPLRYIRRLCFIKLLHGPLNHNNWLWVNVTERQWREKEKGSNAVNDYTIYLYCVPLFGRQYPPSQTASFFFLWFLRSRQTILLFLSKAKCFIRLLYSFFSSLFLCAVQFLGNNLYVLVNANNDNCVVRGRYQRKKNSFNNDANRRIWKENIFFFSKSGYFHDDYLIWSMLSDINTLKQVPPTPRGWGKRTNKKC